MCLPMQKCEGWENLLVLKWALRKPLKLGREAGNFLASFLRLLSRRRRVH